MAVSMSKAATELVDAVVARDFARIPSLLHPEIDFRAMTPSRVWEADAPAEVESAIRAWFEHPERDVKAVEAIEPYVLADTMRVGWRVHGDGLQRPFSFEQQAYLREHDGKVVWLRVICTGPRPV